MPFADSNRVTVRYVEETAWASVASETMKELPITSESLKSSIDTVTSETIRPDRNVADIVKVGGGANGDLGFELKYQDWDELLEGALQSNIVSTVVSTQASAYFSGPGLHIADSSAAQDVVVGQFVRIANASATTNDGDFRVTAVSAVSAGNVLYLADASSGAAASFTSDIFAATTTMKGKRLRNGTTAKSYLFEKEFAGVSTTFQSYAGMRVGSMNMSIQSKSILSGSFTFMGKSQATASTTLASVTVAATTNPVMNASGNVGRIWEGSDAVTGVSFKTITLDLNNNPREQDATGTDALVGVGTGRAEITGSLTAYFENNNLINKFVAGTATSLRFQVTDSDGNSYIFTIPSVRFTDADTLATGPNNDVMVNLSWSAYIDASGLYAIQVDILDA